MITPHQFLRRLLPLCLASLSLATAHAQTLARPGWVGSGITTDLWWKRAVIYQVNPVDFSPVNGSGLHGVTQRLDYIHSLGPDAVLLTSLQPNPAHADTIDPALGTLDDLDELLREASSRHLRVLLDVDPAIPASDLPSVARFWLNRGIAGFHVIGSNDVAHDQAEALRKTTATYLGQRILIADVPPETTSDPTPSVQPLQPQPSTRGRHQAHAISKSPSHPSTVLDNQSPQLLLDAGLASVSPLNATAIRPILNRLQNIQQSGHGLPLFATDGPSFSRSMNRYADGQHDLATARLLATLLFTTRAESLLYYGQELGVRTPSTPNSPLITWDAPPAPAKGQPVPISEAISATPNAALQEADPDSLLNWYRQLSALHHGNSTLASGASFTINRDDQNVLVLVRKPVPGSINSRPLVLLFNLTDQPVHLSLKEDIARLNLRGSFLRTVLRSDNGMGTMHLDSMTLAPYAAYIGELRY